ncbi:endonuclease Q family protein [Lacrimispora sp. NSJ-141]|uniref:Endonuclease Q family protein n=1 Tax=Lientehia hominis TaxID=2897778 RepID=A0AAP2RHE7_9FIRM|nr:endonuclease Q family protein [Lientehia hominis]MCD2491343.1 endonuclease Q family protein [Lientehia hominis]
MAAIDGCEAKFRTPVPEERICPKCGKTIEIFTIRGKVTEETACECGYVVPADEPDSPVVEKKKEE